ncbi:MAG: conjugative transposon protein TraM [Bacteroidota bacterium]|nr:conjugative transposon protein TraM [Bacteroidota bacterium]
MKIKNLSQAYLRQRKMMLVLPVLILPFITLAFWALGGGKVKAGKKEDANLSGLNLHLPDPKVNIGIMDKLAFYDKADRDSLKLKEEMRNDPYYQEHQNDGQPASKVEDIVQSAAGKFHPSSLTEGNQLNPSPYNTSTDQAEEKLMQKLKVLNEVIHQPPSEPAKPVEYPGIDEKLRTGLQQDGKVKGLEKMMQTMDQSSENDPELDQLSRMMDKIIQIQHPEKIKDEPFNQPAGKVFMVSNQSPDDTIVNGFYSLDDETALPKSNAIEAVVNENQVLMNGAVIRLRLTGNAFIKNIKIPAGNFVYGVISLEGERMKVAIHSIRCGNSIYPVKMQVYDMDGLEGIYVPGALTRDVAQQSADNSLQTMQLGSLDPSLAGQATAAGISAAKHLFSKGMKAVKVMVKAGYKVLLK